MLILNQTLQGDVRKWVNVVGRPVNIRAINRCFKDLEKQSILQELDLFHLIGGLDTDAQRLRPLITTSTTKTFTAVASPTLAYNGVTGNGSSSYLNLNWIANTNGVKYSLNSASLGVYSRTNANETTADIGSSDGSSFRSYVNARFTGTMQGYVNNNSNMSKTVGDSLGMFCHQRSSSILTTSFKRGVSVGTDTNTPTGMPIVSFFICCRNANGSGFAFSTRNYSMCFTGSGNIDQLKFYQIIQNYMSEVGLAV